MIPAPADFFGERRIAYGLHPLEKEIVAIEKVLDPLGLDMGCGELAKLLPRCGRPP